jgi:hypothetical protein
MGDNMDKKRYQVKIASIQTWSYVYEVEASDEDEADKLALEAHKQGEESVDNWVVGEQFYQIDDIEHINTL